MFSRLSPLSLHAEVQGTPESREVGHSGCVRNHRQRLAARALPVRTQAGMDRPRRTHPRFPIERAHAPWMTERDTRTVKVSVPACARPVTLQQPSVGKTSRLAQKPGEPLSGGRSTRNGEAAPSSLRPVIVKGSVAPRRPHQGNLTAIEPSARMTPKTPSAGNSLGWESRSLRTPTTLPLSGSAVHSAPFPS
jgi:hypothetical protein